MKKNKMMRLASSLLVAVLLTSSVISGTFAKYVTSDEAQDSARVAKWGVNVTAGGALFSDTYIDAPSTGPDLKVDSNDGAKVVAPGTNNADGAFKFSITGSPEVAVNVKFDVTDDSKDVRLNKGTYSDYTTSDAYDTFNFAEDYYPIRYSLKKGSTTLVNAKPLSELIAYLEGTDMSKDHEPNTDLSAVYGEYEITWEWIFSVDDQTDKKDTFLGNLMVDPSLTDAANYNLYPNFNFSITVTQVN